MERILECALALNLSIGKLPNGAGRYYQLKKSASKGIGEQRTLRLPWNREQYLGWRP
jgi:hypothetical protein